MTNQGRWVAAKTEPVHVEPQGFNKRLSRPVRRLGFLAWRLETGSCARAFCAGALLALSFDIWVLPFQLNGETAQAMTKTVNAPSKLGAEPVGLALPDCTACHGSQNFSAPAARENKPSV